MSKNNEIEKIIEEAFISQKTELDLGYLELTEVPESIGKLQQLHTLSLHNNNITDIPEVIGKLQQLHTLSLSNNNLTDIPEVIGKLQQLQSLYLNNNNLTDIPEVIGKLQQLQYLSLHNNNNLTDIPEVIGKLQQLQSLSLNNNNLTDIPEVIGKLQQLQYLYLHDNNITDIPEVIGKLQQLQYLYLEGNQITDIPEVIGKLQQLHTLSLSNNNITDIPEVIGKLQQLQLLFLHSNNITEISEVIGKLQQLQSLYLHNNNITEIPEVIGKLQQLHTLYLSNNNITDIPEVIGKLQQLHTLSLNNNNITDIPEVIGKLQQLQYLYLHNNNITEIPEVIGKLQQLHTLSLSNNNITDIPEVIGKLQQLHTLSLDGNPLNAELEAASEEGIDAIKAYLQSKLIAQISLYEAKLILVGEGEVGKTCLLDALQGKKWKEHDSTHGIQIQLVKLKAPEDEIEIKLNAWDFGGQRVYRPTHQLFFSSPAIYLVVWKPREGPQQGFVKEWIRLIKHREPGAKILVVATHGGPQQRQPDINRQELWDMFGKKTVIDFFFVNNKPDENGIRVGISELKEAISKLAMSLPEMGRSIPKKWQEVHTQLLNTGKAFLPKAKVLDYCYKYEMSEKEADLFITIYHRLGHFIHYGYDLTLKDIVILKPDWLATAISLVLDDEDTRKAHGLVSYSRLSQLWNDKARDESLRYPSELHPIFLRLMERFDISYKVESLVGKNEADPVNLIAQLVLDNHPHEQLKKVWPTAIGEGNFQQVQMCNIVESNTGQSAPAEGLFYQLIVRLHKYSLGRVNYNESIHWQRGLLLDNDYNGRALLEHKGNNVHITVRAPFPERFLTMLTEEVKYLVESYWEGLDCNVMVPCITPCGKQSPGTGKFEVKKLIESKRASRPDYPCPVCNEWQNIDVLLRNAPSAQASATRGLFTEIESVRKELRRLSQKISNQGVKIMGRFDTLDENDRRVLSKIDSTYAGLINAFTDEAKEGPRLFSFEPVDRTNFNPREWTSSKFRLTFWCEHSRVPVPIHNEKDNKLGIYEIELTRKWLKKTAPYLKFLQGTLSLILPVALSGIELQLDDVSFDEIDEQLSFGKDIVDATLEGGEGIGNWITDKDQTNDLEIGSAIRATDASLRELHSLLKSIDPNHSNLGLKRVLNNHNEFMWVHPKFIGEY